MPLFLTNTIIYVTFFLSITLFYLEMLRYVQSNYAYGNDFQSMNLSYMTRSCKINKPCLNYNL